MNSLSLFTGAGGGILGEILIGFNHVGYVEYNKYCQKILAQRIKDGILANAPIFGDVRKFINQGYAAAYTGMVDVITAGFPCQPFSVAGKRNGENDERNMWPETIDAIRIIRPKFALLENVPGLLSSGYFGRILADISESGYDAKWKVISAAELGAPHKRDRLWIICNSQHNGFTSSEIRKIIETRNGNNKERTFKACKLERSNREFPYVANSTLRKSRKSSKRERREGFSRGSQKISNSNMRRCRQFNIASISDKPRQSRRTSIERRRNSWWSIEPELGRVANGVANRLDRLKAIGNGQVPAVVESAWQIIGDIIF